MLYLLSSLIVYQPFIFHPLDYRVLYEAQCHGAILSCLYDSRGSIQLSLSDPALLFL